MHLDQDVADLIRSRFGAQANHRMVPDLVAPREVLDLEVRELRVGNGDDGAVERAHPASAEAHLDGADSLAEATNTPHRLVGVERDTADEFSNVFCAASATAMPPTPSPPARR